MEKIRIGTRKPKLALEQVARFKKAALKAHKNLNPDIFETITLVTTGDKIKDKSLADFGGKGLFAKELDQALLRGEIDIAIHSAKDLETNLPEGIMIAAAFERIDPRDVFISNGIPLKELRKGALIGTASVRRQAFLSHLRPDLKFSLLRGNVQTRLKAISDNRFDATLLAYAGLLRIGETSQISEIFEIDTIIPSAGQGTLVATCLSSHTRARNFLSKVNEPSISRALDCERAFLRELDGSCHTPIGAYCEINKSGELSIRGAYVPPGTNKLLRTKIKGLESNFVGKEAALDILNKIP